MPLRPSCWNYKQTIIIIISRFVLKTPLIEGVEDSLSLCVLQIDIVERVLRPGIPIPKGGPTEKQKVPVRDWMVPAKIERKNIDYTLEAAITLGKTRGRRKSLAIEDVSIVPQDEERVLEDDQMIEVYMCMYVNVFMCVISRF